MEITKDSHDPRSIWVMQGWLFLDEEYWNVGRAKALLTSASPRGKILVLDLASTTRRVTSSFSHSFLSLSFVAVVPLSLAKKLLNSKPRLHLNAVMIGYVDTCAMAKVT